MGARNFIKVPKDLFLKAQAIGGKGVIVAVVRKVSEGDAERYVKLGLRYASGGLTVPPLAVPPASAGKYSRTNREGREVVRRDLPMVQKTYPLEVPNWGDWGRGSHTIWQTREVYQRDFIPPKELEVSAQIVEVLPEGAGTLVRFAIEQVLDPRATDFEADLLYNLNILQENVGCADVFPSTMSLEDYARTVVVNWEILPPGTIGETVLRIVRGMPSVRPETEKAIAHRVKVLDRLKPQAYIRGVNGFVRYFGAKFTDNLVVFENIHYGNAVYVMFENWQQLSQRSRLRGPITERSRGYSRREESSQ